MRKRAFILNNLFFYLITLSILSLTKDMNSQNNFIQNMGEIWSLLIIVVALSNSMLFSNDQENGVLEQLRMAHLPFPLLILIKVFVYWIGVVLPLIIITPIIMLFLHIPLQYLGILILTLLLSSPSIVWVIALVSALTLHLRHNGLFLIILVIPLLIPVVMVSVGIIDFASAGIDNSMPIGFLIASIILTTTCAPFVISYVLSTTASME